MQTFGGGGGGGEGAMNLKDIFYKKGCGQCSARALRAKKLALRCGTEKSQQQGSNRYLDR